MTAERNSPARKPTPARLTLSASQRLKGEKRVDEVYKTGTRRMAHPLAVHAIRREDEKAARFGISVARRCGNAVRRNLIKRRLREAYRLMQHELPQGVDWLLVVRPHPPLSVDRYQELLRTLLRKPPDRGG